MFLKEEEIRRIIRKRILAEAPQSAVNSIGSHTVRQDSTGGPYMYAGSGTILFESMASFNDDIETTLKEVLKPSNYVVFENEVNIYMEILGLSDSDILLHPERGGDDSIHGYAKKLTDETLEYGIGGMGTGQAQIGFIMQELGERLKSKSFSLFDMSRLAKYFKDKKDALSGQTSAMGYLTGRAKQEKAADLDKILLYSSDPQSELSAGDVMKYVIDPFIEGSGEQTVNNLVAYRIKKGVTMRDGNLIPKNVSVTCGEILKGLYAGKFTPGYDQIASSTSGGGTSGGSSGTPGSSASGTVSLDVEAEDIAGKNIIQKIEFLLQRYAKKNKLSGRLPMDDETYDSDTAALFNTVARHGLDNHAVFGQRGASIADRRFVASGVFGSASAVNTSETIPAAPYPLTMAEISSAFKSELPTYTNDYAGMFCFLLDLVNNNTVYGDADRNISSKIRTSQPAIGGTGGTGGTGGPPPGSVSGGINTLSAQPQANEDKIDISLEFTGTAQNLEALGFPAGTAASGDQTTVGLKRIFANRMPKNRTTTGGKLIMRIVVNKKGAITNVRVAPEDTNKSYSKRFKNVIKQYLNTVPANAVIYNNLPGSGRTKSFNLVIDIESGIYT